MRSIGLVALVVALLCVVGCGSKDDDTNKPTTQDVAQDSGDEGEQGKPSGPDDGEEPDSGEKSEPEKSPVRIDPTGEWIESDIDPVTLASRVDRSLRQLENAYAED